MNFICVVSSLLDLDADSGWEKFGSQTKKRKSRWATENESDKTILNGLPTTVPAGLTKEQEDQYLCESLVLLRILFAFNYCDIAF